MRRIFYGIIFAVIFAGCASTNSRHISTGSSWDDARLVAEQQLELERQSKLIADLERIIQSGADNLAEAERYLGELKQGNLNFEDWLRRVDEFVRRVIAVQRELESIQQTNRGENAGTR